MKKTIEEVRDYLLENRVDEYGNLNLLGLDFGEFDGTIYISHMTVKGDLIQTCHKVQGDLYQGGHEVGLYLSQGHHQVQGDYYSKDIKVSGNIECEEPIKLLKEITREELEKMGYRLKHE